VVCLQEVFEEDLPKLKDQFYSNHLFLPIWRTGQHFNLEIKEGYLPGDKLFGTAGCGGFLLAFSCFDSNSSQRILLEKQNAVPQAGSGVSRYAIKNCELD